MTTAKAIVYVIAVLTCLARFAIEPHPISIGGAYQAAAHLFVGGLFGAWVARREWWLMATGLAMSVVEVVAAVATRV